jgi:hypothetical protein
MVGEGISFLIERGESVPAVGEQIFRTGTNNQRARSREYRIGKPDSSSTNRMLLAEGHVNFRLRTDLSCHFGDVRSEG